MTRGGGNLVPGLDQAWAIYDLINDLPAMGEKLQELTDLAARAEEAQTNAEISKNQIAERERGLVARETASVGKAASIATAQEILEGDQRKLTDDLAALDLKAASVRQAEKDNQTRFKDLDIREAGLRADLSEQLRLAREDREAVAALKESYEQKIAIFDSFIAGQKQAASVAA